MDAKTKADFINAVASGSKIPCPNCNMLNEPDSKFCISCGTKLVREETKPANDLPFQKVEKPAGTAPTSVEQENKPDLPFQPASSAAKEANSVPKQEASYIVYEEPKSVFAEGLPEWSIEPPQVVVRRRRSK